MKQKFLLSAILILVILGTISLGVFVFTQQKRVEQSNISTNISKGKPQEGKKICGDGVCDGPETAENCPEDCGGGNQSSFEQIIITEKREPLLYTGGQNFFSFNPLPNSGKNAKELYENPDQLERAKTRLGISSERNAALGEKFGIV